MSSFSKIPDDKHNIPRSHAQDENIVAVKVTTEVHLNKNVLQSDQNLIGNPYSSKTKRPSIHFELVEQGIYKHKQKNTNPYKTRVSPFMKLKQIEPSYVPSVHFTNGTRQSLRVRFEKVFYLFTFTFLYDSFCRLTYLRRKREQETNI